MWTVAGGWQGRPSIDVESASISIRHVCVALLNPARLCLTLAHSLSLSRHLSFSQGRATTACHKREARPGGPFSRGFSSWRSTVVGV